LRDFCADDFQDVHAYARDPEVVRFVQWGPNTEADTHGFLAHVLNLSEVKPRLDFELAVVWAPENRLIGGASIHISDQANREGWIGYCLNREFWGRGVATEAAKALVAFGFAALELHRIYATCDPANVGSRTVLQKIGMRQEGHFRSHKLVRGKWRDTEIFAIIDDEAR
jgi:RimJ/RimL family protein N-acetyltransferase